MAKAPGRAAAEGRRDMCAPCRQALRVGGSGGFLWSGRGDKGKCWLAAEISRSPRAERLSLGRWGAAARVNARDTREPVTARGGMGHGAFGGEAPIRGRGAQGGYPEGEAAWTRGASALKGPGGPGGPPEHVRQRWFGGATT